MHFSQNLKFKSSLNFLWGWDRAKWNSKMVQKWFFDFLVFLKTELSSMSLGYIEHSTFVDRVLHRMANGTVMNHSVFKKCPNKIAVARVTVWRRRIVSLYTVFFPLEQLLPLRNFQKKKCVSIDSKCSETHRNAKQIFLPLWPITRFARSAKPERRSAMKF